MQHCRQQIRERIGQIETGGALNGRSPLSRQEALNILFSPRYLIGLVAFVLPSRGVHSGLNVRRWEYFSRTSARLEHACATCLTRDNASELIHLRRRSCTVRYQLMSCWIQFCLPTWLPPYNAFVLPHVSSCPYEAILTPHLVTSIASLSWQAQPCVLPRLP